MISAFRTELRHLLGHPILVLPLVLVSVPLFYDLGDHSIYMWDEAIYANNALEMRYTGDWFVIRNNGEPSHYNVKPPLVTWLQAVSMGLFGVTEWALRLPSALAGLCVSIMLWIFSRRWFSTFLPGVLASIILVSAYGFVRVHLVRSGDLDAVLLLFTTAATLLLVDYLLMNGRPERYVWPVTLAIVLGFFAKSLGALLPLVPILIIFLFDRRGRAFLRHRKTWFAMLAATWIIILFYFARDVAQPGYFKMVWSSEFMRLTHNVMPWHEHPFSYYLVNFIRLDFFNPHLYFLAPAILMLLWQKDRFTRMAASIMAAFCVTYLLFISIPVVKLEWYDAPFYPIAAFLLGTGIWQIDRLLKDQFSGKSGPAPVRWKFSFLVMALVLLFPYRSVLEFYAQNNYPAEPLEREGHFIRQLSKDQPGLNRFAVFMRVQTPEHLDQMQWYRKKLNWWNGYAISHVDRIDELSAGDTVLCCQQKGIQALQDAYRLSVVAENPDCRVVVVADK